MMLLWALLGCPKPPAVPQGVSSDDPAEAPGVRREQVEGPTAWSEPGGLCLDVPGSWTGTTGAAPLLELSHPSGVRVVVVRWGPAPVAAAAAPSPEADGTTPSRPPQPPPLRDPTWGQGDEVRPGFTVAFEDRDAYRTVPLFAGGGTYTLAPTDPKGPLAQGWYGEVDGQIVALEATFPFGHVTDGRDVVVPILNGLCRR